MDQLNFKYCPNCGISLKQNINIDILNKKISDFSINISGAIIEKPSFGPFGHSHIGNYDINIKTEDEILEWAEQNYKQIIQEMKIRHFFCDDHSIITVHNLLLVLLKYEISNPIIIRSCILTLSNNKYAYFRKECFHNSRPCSHQICDEDTLISTINKIPSYKLYYSKNKHKIYLRKELEIIFDNFDEFIDIDIDRDVEEFKICEVYVFILSDVLDNLLEIYEIVSKFKNIPFRKSDSNNINKLFKINI